MTTASSTSEKVATDQRSVWFLNPWFDGLLIVCTPLLIWPLIMQAEAMWSAELLGKLILLTATGHYFATFVRAYGDIRLRDRFLARFTIVPIALLITCVMAFRSGAAGPLLLVTGMWAFWHWLAQAFGFARIYDAKVGSFRPTTAFLDKALVVIWFVGAVVLNDRATGNFAALFLNSSIALPGATFFVTLRLVVLGLVVAVTVAYFANLILSITRGERVSWIKQACHVTTIGFYWFAFGYTSNFFVAYVLYELFHDVQYFAIVWLSGRSRTRREGVTRWMRGLFRSGIAHVCLFVVAMVAFGAIDMTTRSYFEDDQVGNILKGVFITAALLHYYYDGFIWRVRESDMRSDLGIAGGAAGRARSGMLHVGAWGLFFIPLALLTANNDTEFSPAERARMTIAAAPDSFEVQANYAHALVSAGDFEEGLKYYARSVEAFPNWAKTRFNYAAALDFHGHRKAAIEHYEHAIRCRNEENLHAASHVNLGVCLFLDGDRSEAAQHFVIGEQLGGQSAQERFADLSHALEQSGRTDRAIDLRRAAIARSPNAIAPRLGLADTLARARRFENAAIHYSAALKQAPTHPGALVGMAVVRLEQGRRVDAKILLDRALAANPDDPRVRALEERLGRRR